MKIRLAPFVLAFLLVSLAAQGEENKRASYEQLEAAYKNGLCDYPPLEGQSRRRLALLFLEDVIYSATGNDGLTGSFVGDMDIFKIGRSPDETLIALYEYADRKDVADAAHDDAKKMNKINQEVLKGDGLPESMQKALYCSLYLMLEGKDFEFKSDLDSYFQSLNRKVRNRNIENLNRLTRDYQ